MNTPVDQHDRDRIRQALGESLFVEAGAGTGKTRSLIDRIVELVRSGVELRNIAAITFTEAAAAELKDRLRQAIESNAAESTPDSVEHERWARAVDQLDSAAIQTLHSFAQRILAAHPLEAGLPPGFQLLDGVQSGLAFDERWRIFLESFLGDDGPEDVAEVLLGLNVNFDGLRSAAKALHDNWDRLEDLDLQIPPPPDVTADDLVVLLDDLCGYIGQNTKPDTLADRLQPLPAVVEAIRDADTAYAVLRSLYRTWVPLTVGKAENWPKGMTTEIRGVIRDVRTACDALRERYAGWCAEALLAHLARFALDYAAERRQAGTLEFHDLLTLARDLLRTNDDVRRAVHHRFTHVLIDEFQDTDPLQIEIASLIVRPADCPGDVPWHEAPVPPGSLVVVGDPKQSIYRFRRADIQLYLAAAEQLSSSRVGLVQNWRSKPSILNWVNHVFGELIGPAPDPDAGQPAYVDLHPGRDATGETSHVHWFGAQFKRADEAREEEAEAIARAILAVRDDAWPVRRETEAGHVFEGARLSDIAILFPRRTILQYLERVFEAHGIPYRVESRSLLYETQEIVDLGHILAALADPTDDVAIVAALRSPAFACSDRDLLEWVTHKGQWDYTSSPPDGLTDDHPVARAMAWLRQHHDDAALRPVHEVVETVIRERSLMHFAFAFRRPRERWQRYRFVLDQARAFAESPGASLRGFVTWLRRQADEGADVVESAVPEPDDDAVRLMTVHASKGLEFPVVVLSGLGAARNNKSRPVTWDDDGRPVLSVGRIASDGLDAIKDQESAREDAEALRVLYVAATRACDHLLVSLFRGSRNDNHAATLSQFVEGNEHLWREMVLDTPIGEAAPGPRAVEPPAEDRDTWLARRQQAITERSSGPAIAATAIARMARAADAGEPDEGEQLDEAQPWKRGRAGTHVGRAVHAALQTIDLATGEGLEPIARAQALAEGVPNREGEVRSLVRAALESPTVREAVASGRFWREVFVAAEVNGRLVEGFIDLLYERDGQLIVVDYKTDALRTAADIDAAVGRYRLQAAAYATALERQLGRPVAECRFIFVREGGAEERVLPDLRDAIGKVEETLATAR